MFNNKTFLPFILGVCVVVYFYKHPTGQQEVSIVEPPRESVVESVTVNYMSEEDVYKYISSFEKSKMEMESVNKVARVFYDKNKRYGWDVAVDAAQAVVDNSDETFDTDFIMSLLYAESLYKYDIVSSANAIGIGQIQPETGKWIAEKMAFVEWDKNRLYDPSYNIRLSMAYIRFLYKQFDGNLHATLTAYNRGIYGAERYEENRGTYRSGYSEDIVSRSQARRFSVK